MLTGETSLNIINASEADSAYFEEMRCEVKGRAGQEHNKCQPRTTAQCTASVGNTGVSEAPVEKFKPFEGNRTIACCWSLQSRV